MSQLLRFLLIILAILSLSACKGSKKLIANPTPEHQIYNEKSARFISNFYEGVRQKENHLFDQALETFQFCEQLDSLDGGLQAELADIYTQINRPEAALNALKKAYASNPENWWYGVNLISMYAALKQYNPAIDIALELKNKFENKSEVYQILSALYSETNQPKMAIEAFNKLESLNGVSEQISMSKFDAYIKLNKNKNAIAEIDKLSAKFPSNMRFKVLRGDIYMYQRQPEKALEIYNQVAENEPENPFVYVSLSEYYKQKGDNELAKTNIVKALKVEGLEVEQKISILGNYIKDFSADSTKMNDTETLFKLLINRYPLEEKVYGYYALYLRFRNRDSEAIPVFETMLNLNSKNEQTWIEFIQLYIKQQNFDSVRSLSQKGSLEIPESHILYFYRGLAEFQLKDFKSAIGAFSNAISRVKPAEQAIKSDYYAHTGDAYYQLDSAKLAFENYEKALEYNPANIYVLNNYAYFLSEKNLDLKKAERMSSKTIEKEPKNSTYLDTYAWIFYKQGNYTLAKFYIERAIDNSAESKDMSTLYDHYGDILIKSDNKKKALEMWKKALESQPNAEDIKKKIDILNSELEKK